MPPAMFSICLCCFGGVTKLEVRVTEAVGWLACSHLACAHLLNLQIMADQCDRMEVTIMAPDRANMRFVCLWIRQTRLQVRLVRQLQPPRTANRIKKPQTPLFPKIPK
eukprot:155612-Amphidinium_carterae.1